MEENKRYSVCQDGNIYATLEQAIAVAEELPAGSDSDEPSTFTVVDEHDPYLPVVASFTNRRITGGFVKQVWTGRKKDYAEEVETVEFDATDHILLMEYERFTKIEDNDYESDEIGRDFVSWDGPCVVHIEESICEYFGVSEIRDITEALFNQVKAHVNAQPSVEVAVDITVRVKLSAVPGTDIEAVLHNLGYNFISNTVGAVIRSTEIIDQNVLEKGDAL